MNIDEREIENWINFPRYLREYRASNYISRQEFHTYVWIRLSADRYGKAIISLGDIRKEVFDNGIKKKTVYCYFKSLKDKELIYYTPRAGKGGSYLVYLGDFLYKDKDGNVKYTDLSRYFNRINSGGEHTDSNEGTGYSKNEISRSIQVRNALAEKLDMNKKLSNLGGNNNE